MFLNGRKTSTQRGGKLLGGRGEDPKFPFSGPMLFSSAHGRKSGRPEKQNLGSELRFSDSVQFFSPHRIIKLNFDMYVCSPFHAQKYNLARTAVWSSKGLKTCFEFPPTNYLIPQLM